jgi:DNA-binding NtrC family response regulator
MSGRDLILCVDDEENQLAIRKLVLEREGYKVMAASSGQQALLMLDRHSVDLVLSDHLMPGLVGTELTRKIKLRFPNMPVILISAVNEIPPDAVYADLFMSKLDGPLVMCRNVSEILLQSKNRMLSRSVCQEGFAGQP